MRSLLPVVTKDTATGIFRDLILDEMGTSPQLAIGWMLQVAGENPGIVKAVNEFMSGSPEAEKVAALIGMSIAYRVLSAQAEVEALNRMAL